MLSGAPGQDVRMARREHTMTNSMHPRATRELLRSLWRSYRRESSLRGSIRALLQLDDHTLRDMGLRREDIAAAVRGRLCG
jgi:uncharacterized protein YjiS (DUF1127 family)